MVMPSERIAEVGEGAVLIMGHGPLDWSLSGVQQQDVSAIGAEQESATAGEPRKSTREKIEPISRFITTAVYPFGTAGVIETWKT